MKLKDLKNVLVSERGSIQSAIVYDCNKNVDLEVGCSLEYATSNYGEYDIIRIGSYYDVNKKQDYVVITVM